MNGLYQTECHHGSNVRSQAVQHHRACSRLVDRYQLKVFNLEGHTKRRWENGTASVVIKAPNNNSNPINDISPSPNDRTTGHTTGELHVGIISVSAVLLSGPSSFSMTERG